MRKRVTSIYHAVGRSFSTGGFGVHTPGKVHHDGTIAGESSCSSLAWKSGTNVVNPADQAFQIDKRRTPSSFHSTPFPGLPVTVAYPSVTVKGSVRIGAIQSDHSSQSADSLTRSSCAETNA